MGKGACKSTKGWTFNQKSSFKKTQTKKTRCRTILLDRRHCQNSVGNIEQLIDPEGLIAFVKYD